jgi:hypothetical protein
MRRGLVWLAASCVVAIGGLYVWTHRWQVAESVAAPQGPVADVNTESSQAGEVRGMVTITGPLADWKSLQSPGQTQRPQPRGTTSSSAAPSYEPTQADLVGDSPVGTSMPILHKTFAVAALANLPFDIPPNAANPQLHGTYRAFVPKRGVAKDGAPAEVEFLVMNQQQYDALLSGHPADEVFSAGDAHNQEVSTNLSPTFSQPVRYYLVFRNNSRDSRKKMVEADFWVDF